MNLPTCISSNRKIRYTVCFVILITLSVLFFIVSVCAGSVQIPLSDIWRQFRGEQDELYAAILFQIRIPRTFAAILLGGALALSGYLLQTFFHNPIAGPFVLGISSGAKLFVAVVMIVFLRYSRTLSSVDLIVTNFPNAHLNHSYIQKTVCNFTDVFIANPAYFNLKQQEIPFEELKQYPILMLDRKSTTSEFLHNLFLQHQLELIPEVELSSNDLLIDLARIGLGIAFIPDYCLSRESKDLYVVKTKEKLPSRQMVASINPTLPVSQSTEEFLKLLPEL